MKWALFVLFLAVTLSAQSSQPPTNVRPDEATALKIAEPALIRVYGKRQIDYERQLRADLHDGIWTVNTELYVVLTARGIVRVKLACASVAWRN